LAYQCSINFAENRLTIDISLRNVFPLKLLISYQLCRAKSLEGRRTWKSSCGAQKAAEIWL